MVKSDKIRWPRKGMSALEKNTNFAGKDRRFKVEVSKEHQVLDKNTVRLKYRQKKDFRLVIIIKIIYNYCHPSFFWNNSGKNPSRKKTEKRQHRYRRSDNQLFVLSDDQAPRWMRGFPRDFSAIWVLSRGRWSQRPNRSENTKNLGWVT